VRGNLQALFGKRPTERTRPRAPRRRSTSLGERPGETGQEQSQDRAPGRLNVRCKALLIRVGERPSTADPVAANR
jgi:hypothetical protein